MFEKQVKYSVFAFLPTAAGILALTLPVPTWLRGILALGWLLGSGRTLGDALFPAEKRGWQTYLGSLVFAAAVTAIGGAVYLLYRLNLFATFLVVVGTSIGVVAYAAKVAARRVPFGASVTVAMRHLGADANEEEKEDEQDRTPAAGLLRKALGAIAVIGALALLWIGIQLLTGASTDESIRSPWDFAPRAIFLLFFLAASLTFIASHGGLAPRAALVPSAMLAMFAAAVAALTYKVGFGFDPFLHRATEQVIFTDGFISPKPLYYLGQYAVVTITARLIGGYVSAIDTWLVPVSLALVIPCAAYALRRTFGFSFGQAAAASLAVLALPLSSFAATTPQGFANALFLMAAFLALPAATGLFPLRVVALLAVATAAVHPLAGVPLLLFVAVLYTLRQAAMHQSHPFSWRQLVPYAIALAGTAALPAVFAFNSLLSGSGVTLDAENVSSASSVLGAFQASNVPTRRFDLFLDLVYGWKAVRAGAILLAALGGILLLRKRGAAWQAWALGAFACLGNFVLLKTLVQFPFLIEYERHSYADRLFELTLFLAAPLMCAAIAWALTRVRNGQPAVRLGATSLVAMLLASSLYLAYPRRDQYEASRGWSTSAADVETVLGINRDAGGKEYVTLANQSVSAAAVRELGFRTYYTSTNPKSPEPIFFYPIPTGGPLYSQFLEINKARGSRAEAIQAMDLAGTDLAYYVVTYYWWDAQRITMQAKKQADKYWVVDGKNYVFKYER